GGRDVRAGAGGAGQDGVLEPGEFAALHRRATGLIQAAERSADPARLAEALSAAQAAVDATPVGLPVYRAPALANLGLLLRLRYERSGALPDLHEAVAAHRAAAAA